MEYVLFTILGAISLVLILFPHVSYKFDRWIRIHIKGYKSDVLAKEQPPLNRSLTRIVGVIGLIIILIGTYAFYRAKQDAERFDATKLLEEIIERREKLHEDEVLRPDS